jgi:hypothetical protein
MTNVEVCYGNLPKISNVVRMRRMRFARHCSRAENQPIHHLVFKDPEKYAQGKGASVTYEQAIRKDIVNISRGSYHLKDLTSDKLKMLASKDFQGNTYD